MSIKSLYRNYFQKSKTFLYPTLGIERGNSCTPIQTYMAWEGYYTPQDHKLICLYYLRNDPEFIHFEKYKLQQNRLFDDFKQVEQGKGIYVFDFSSLKHDWDMVLQGHYSQLSSVQEKIITNYYSDNQSTYAYVESYLYPEKYFGMYAEILGVSISELREVGELCSNPDVDKETLSMEVKPIILNPL